MTNAPHAHVCTQKKRALPDIVLVEPGTRFLAPLVKATDMATPLSNSLMMIADDARATLQRHQDAGERAIWPGHIGRWGGLELRRDHLGKMWDRPIVMVSDDFGNLVEVAQ